jgi:hypothetical protein
LRRIKWAWDVARAEEETDLRQRGGTRRAR